MSNRDYYPQIPRTFTVPNPHHIPVPSPTMSSYYTHSPRGTSPIYAPSYTGSTDSYYVPPSPRDSPRSNSTSLAYGSEHSHSSAGRSHPRRLDDDNYSTMATTGRDHYPPQPPRRLRHSGPNLVVQTTGHRRHHSGGSNSSRGSRSPVIPEPQHIYVEEGNGRGVIYDNEKRHRKSRGGGSTSSQESPIILVNEPTSRGRRRRNSMALPRSRSDDEVIVDPPRSRSRSRSRHRQPKGILKRTPSQRRKSVKWDSQETVIQQIRAENEEISRRPAIRHSDSAIESDDDDDSYARPRVITRTFNQEDLEHQHARQTEEQNERLKRRQHPPPTRRSPPTRRASVSGAPRRRESISTAPPGIIHQFRY